jgi:hypothetical protein
MTSDSVALCVMRGGEARRVPRLTSVQRGLTREVAVDRREISRRRIYFVVYSLILYGTTFVVGSTFPGVAIKL